jgi:hypothetical protein
MRANSGENASGKKVGGEPGRLAGRCLRGGVRNHRQASRGRCFLCGFRILGVPTRAFGSSFAQLRASQEHQVQKP